MEYLSSYVYDHPQIELGIEKLPVEESHMIHAVLDSCKVIRKEVNGIEEYCADPDESSEDGMLLFGNILLPIFEKTESDMLRLIKEWGYLDIMKHVWFCHQPYQGRPCGMCHPCEVKMGAGMEFCCRKILRRDITFKINIMINSGLKSTVNYCIGFSGNMIK